MAKGTTGGIKDVAQFLNGAQGAIKFTGVKFLGLLFEQDGEAVMWRPPNADTNVVGLVLFAPTDGETETTIQVYGGDDHD